jgi:3-oxoacyl-[acyl-carrier protein] reductase
MGRATALELSKGAQVLVHYSSGAKEADVMIDEIRKAGGRADAVQAGLSAADGAHNLALDILVANAGISKSASVEETTVEDFDRPRTVLPGAAASADPGQWQ